MSAHRVIIEAGPGIVRRLCCSATLFDGKSQDASSVALAAIDDPVTLVADRPVAVDSLWRDVLRSLDCRSCDSRAAVVIVHPSWWAASRVGLLAEAARSLADEVVLRPRSWLLLQAGAGSAEVSGPSVVVEIVDGFVVVTGAARAATARLAAPRQVADDVARLVLQATGGRAATVCIDGPRTVVGAPALAPLIADALRGVDGDLHVVAVDDDRLRQVAMARLAADGPAVAEPASSSPVAGAEGVRSTPRVRWARVVAGLGVATTVAALVVGGFAWREARPAPPAGAAPTTALVVGGIALTVPAQWPRQPVVVGAGSARIELSSPSDPEVALHVMQARVVNATLSSIAERLKRAIDRALPGVFVDFNPAGATAGRAAVTYREVRPGHDIWWTVWCDGMVRISVGCQSRPGRQDAVWPVCEQAVQSARSSR